MTTSKSPASTNEIFGRCRCHWSTVTTFTAHAVGIRYRCSKTRARLIALHSGLFDKTTGVGGQTKLTLPARNVVFWRVWRLTTELRMDRGDKLALRRQAVIPRAFAIRFVGHHSAASGYAPGQRGRNGIATLLSRHGRWPQETNIGYTDCDIRLVWHGSHLRAVRTSG